MPTFSSVYPYVDFYPLFDKNSWGDWPNDGTMVEGWVGDWAYSDNWDSGSGPIYVYNAALIWLHEGRAYLDGRFYWLGPDWDTDEGGYAPSELLTAPIPSRFRPVADTDITLHSESQQCDPAEIGQSIVLRIRTDGTIGIIGRVPHSEIDHVYNASDGQSWAVESGATDTASGWHDLPIPNDPFDSDGEQAIHTNRVHLRGDFWPVIDNATALNVFGDNPSEPIASSIPNPPFVGPRTVLPASNGRRYTVAVYSNGLLQTEGAFVPDAGPVAEIKDGTLVKGAWDTPFVEDGYTFHIAEAAGAYAGLPTVDFERYTETSYSEYGIFIPDPLVAGKKAQTVIRYSSGSYYAIRYETKDNGFGGFFLEYQIVRVISGTVYVLAGPFSVSIPSGFDITYRSDLGGYLARSRHLLTIAETSGGTQRLDYTFLGHISASLEYSTALLDRGREGYAVNGLVPMRNMIAYSTTSEQKFPQDGVTTSLDGVGWPWIVSRDQFMMVV